MRPVQGYGFVAVGGPEQQAFGLGDEVFGGCADTVGGWAPRARVTAGSAAHRPDGVSAPDIQLAVARGLRVLDGHITGEVVRTP